MTGEDKKCAEQSRSVEEGFALLDEMTAKLESPDVTLEESFRLYQEGMEILKEIRTSIDTYEKKIQVIMNNGETEEFV